MNIYNIDGRQDVKAAVFEVTAADFVKNGGVIEFECEPGSIMIGARIKKLAAFDGTTDTFTFGTADAPTRYGTAVTLKDTAVVSPALDDAVLGAAPISNKLRLTRAFTGVPTAAGRLRVALQFVRLGKADTTQGNYSAPSAAPNPGP